jgi:hypothetical protein
MMYPSLYHWKLAFHHFFGARLKMISSSVVAQELSHEIPGV